MTIKNLGKNILFQCSITLQNQKKRMINVTITLTLLSRMKLPTFVKWTSPFSSPGLVGVVFHYYSNFNRAFFKQKVENLIRYCSLWRLILVCTICLCPTKRTLVYYRLNNFVVYVTRISCIVSSSNLIIVNRHGVCHMRDRNHYN